ncbi:MAG: hypothetical protein C0617_11575 [Desulfuromonas sp.]|uniref:GSU3473 family protein n=1 Tax=Desulfuromonas sp. TaxID=892 RepID=UPI000CCAE352|nr:hypothetical protein [Desulfuromonas sp.]PLX83173.1 MAG: hypothetical protein C0617_11575 [Desulfuromonas sp.]
MMIRVEYTDGQQQLVRPHLLKKLLASRTIAWFERSGQWARVDEDALRNPGGNADYSGPERRSAY